MRTVAAAVLGVLAFFLLFLLGESQKSTLVVFAGMGAYFLIVMFLLALGASRARRGLALLALNAALVLATVIAVLVEPNRLAVLQTVGIAATGLACSLAGWALAARIPGRSPQAGA